jgi:transposase
MKVTPPKLAKRYGVDVHKIIAWVRSGELPAMNSATTQGGRPRFLIDESDILAFETRRSVEPARKSTRKPRQKSTNVIEFF